MDYMNEEELAVMDAWIESVRHTRAFKLFEEGHKKYDQEAWDDLDRSCE